jgi:hypothetical protein
MVVFLRGEAFFYAAVKNRLWPSTVLHWDRRLEDSGSAGSLNASRLSIEQGGALRLAVHRGGGVIEMLKPYCPVRGYLFEER